MKQQANQHHTQKKFNVGDWVILWLHLKQDIYEKEISEILHALKEWKPCLMGRQFKVIWIMIFLNTF